MSYGRVPLSLLQSSTPSIVIDNGNKYRNGVELAKLFLSEYPTTQFVLTAGTFLESGAGTGCTENNGYEGTGTVNIPVGTSSATWSFPGDAYGEISFSVFGPGGEELYVGAQGATGPGLLPITLCAQ